MNRTRASGIISVLGLLLALYAFTATNINPNLTLVDLGLVIGVSGMLVVVVEMLRKWKTGVLPPRVNANTIPEEIHNFGLLLLFIGGIAAFAGFLLGNQVACSCPANGPCDCGFSYVLMLYLGLASVVAGTMMIIIHRFF